MLHNKDLVRHFIFRLGAILSKLDCTTVLTSEAPGEGSTSAYDVEEFIADGIIKLHRTVVKNEVRRLFQIIKMRGINFDSNIHPYKIGTSGIMIFSDIFTNLDYGSSKDKISTGNAVLDKLLLGGVYKASTSLITGSTGTGKSLISTQFLHQGLKSEEPSLYVGFEESKDQIIRNAEGFGWDLKEFEKRKLLTFNCVYPRSKSLQEHLIDIKLLVEKYKVKRCVVDSLSAMEGSYTSEILMSFTRKLNSYLKSMNVVTFLTFATSALVGAGSISDVNLSTLTDNIIILRYAEILKVYLE